MGTENLAEMLRAPVEDIEEKIECRRCGAICLKDAMLCLGCGENPNVPTLAEWGCQLPIGIANPREETLGREFSVKKIDYRIEKAISDQWARFRKSSRRVSTLDYLPCVLAFTLQTLDGQDFTHLSVDKRIGFIRAMFLGDIFYIYAWIRVETLGPDFTLKDVECPLCRHKFDYNVNLTSLEVATRDNYSELFKTVELRDGFLISGSVRKKVTIMPFTLQAIAGMDVDSEIDSFTAMLKASVCGIEGMPEGISLSDSEISQLTKYDMATLESKMGFVSGGPDWSIDMKCQMESCGNTWIEGINWRYGDFFSHSSRSTARRRSRT